ncbi:2-dehydro-3-deoxyphosphogalactonate aldolase [Brevundimonas alba]|uniref:2-dehydro-3-deoxyphosphogalactonate aldolase n=1 Tax=Brevundimonas alba TaxID=74314 RepID=A0A7X6BMN3_9CAUL|nr:2-dehydro-3-deoxy-6-phosphogalactonate aldolase [Brevundimonas alba]NJC39845.1 2-dehydro-3-deoxyphosphogalactonate aldolase [Brevundimonas alba]
MTDAEMLAILDDLPLVAILRGLKPDEAVEVGEAIVAAGFRCLEVPLNSPEPLDSIRRLRDALDGRAVVGAGTVLTPTAVADVARAGSQIVISPNTNAEVIRAAKAAGLLSMPGFFTPSEAFVALGAGADVLKLFPAEIAGPGGLKAVRAVLPAATRVYAVGGVDPASVPTWVGAGASGFGIGSAIFKPGRSAAEPGDAAAAFVQAWKNRKG